MVKYALAGVLSVAFSVAFLGGANADSSALDDKLEDRIEARYSDAKISGLDVDVNDGVATLSGEVATNAEKARAEKMARAAGARAVVNRLVIDTDKTAARIEERAEAKKAAIDDRAELQKERIDRQTAAAKDRLDERSPRTVDGVDRVESRPAAVKTGTTAERTRASNEPRQVGTDVGNVVDPWVTTKVKTKILAEDLLDKSSIDVDTSKDGVVTLKGTVPSATAKVRALELARTTDGVRSVVDRLEVKAPIEK